MEVDFGLSGSVLGVSAESLAASCDFSGLLVARSPSQGLRGQPLALGHSRGDEPSLLSGPRFASW